MASLKQLIAVLIRAHAHARESIAEELRTRKTQAATHYDFCSSVIVISSVMSFHKAVLVNHR